MSSQVVAIESLVFKPVCEKTECDLLQSIVESLVDGVLIVTMQGEWVYGNYKAHQICQQLNLGKPLPNRVPKAIWQLCQAMLTNHSANLERPMVVEGEVGLDEIGQCRVRIRWLKLEEVQRPYLLVTLEDCGEAARNRAIAEAYRYGLTPRQAEVWLLHRMGFTYRHMATQLYITPNTIKRHMKDIYAKQKCFDEA